MPEPRNPENVALTDAEWFAFQRIPDQGYSHRAWVDARIRERVAQALEAAATDPSLRLSGHSGVSISRLHARATALRTASNASTQETPDA